MYLLIKTQLEIIMTVLNLSQINMKKWQNNFFLLANKIIFLNSCLIMWCIYRKISKLFTMGVNAESSNVIFIQK